MTTEPNPGCAPPAGAEAAGRGRADPWPPDYRAPATPIDPPGAGT